MGQTRVSGVSRSQTVVRRRLLQIGLGFGALLVLSQTACSRTPEAVEEVVPLASVAPQPVAPTADDLPAPPDFFVPRAQFHLEALAALSPRSAGERNDLAARAYLERAFGGLGAVLADVSDREAPEARPEARTRDGSPASPSPSTDGRPAPRHLLARFPGRSPDVVLLVAPYPAVGEDDWIGDSSVALLIELARVLSLEPPAYTIEIALAETRTTLPPDLDAPIGPTEARRHIVSAGESLARALAAAGRLDAVRAVLLFDTGARADLRIARDLRSHPVYRELVWDSAGELGFGKMFSRNAGWASARSLHLGFRARGMDRVVALVDESRARAELVPVPLDTGVSADTWEALGRVSRTSIERIFHRLARIDAFQKAEQAGGNAPADPEQASPRIPEISPSS